MVDLAEEEEGEEEEEDDDPDSDHNLALRIKEGTIRGAACRLLPACLAY